MKGFSLLEIMIAIFLLTGGLLSAGQLLFVAASSESLARSKGTAAIAAQNMLESLMALYEHDPTAPDLAFGSHGPKQAQVVNPVDESILNRFNIAWDVWPVPDPRPGKVLDAKRVTVSVVPILPGGTINIKPSMNKILNVSTILSLRAR